MKRPGAALLVIAILVPVYMALFVAKRLPMSDEGMALVLSRELAEGRAPYLHLESPYTPLAFMIQGGWMRLVGPGIVANRVITILYALISALAVFLALRRPLGHPGAVLAGLAVVAATYPYHCYVSYNNAAMFFGILSACAILSMRDAGDARRAALAGLFAGLAFFAKQNLGGLALVAACGAVLLTGRTLKERLRTTAFFLAGGLLPFLLLGLHAVRNGYAGALVEQAFLGGLEHGAHFAASYPMDQWIWLTGLLVRPSLAGLDAFAHSAAFLLPFVIAVALVPFIVAALRAGARERVRILAAAAIMTPIAALGAIHAPTTWHFIFVKPIPIIAGALLLKEISRLPAGRPIAALGIVLFFTLHFGRQAMIFDGYTASIDAPHAAGIRVRAWEGEIINRALAALRLVPPQAPLFVAAVDPMYYYLTDRRPTLPWIYLNPPSVSESFARQLVKRIEASRCWILVVNGRSALFDYRRIPALERHLESLEPAFDETVNGIRITLCPPAGE